MSLKAYSRTWNLFYKIADKDDPQIPKIWMYPRWNIISLMNVSWILNISVYVIDEIAQLMKNHNIEEDLFWARRIVDSKDHNGVTPYNQRTSSNEEVSNRDNVVKMHDHGDKMKKLRALLMSINVFGVIICTVLLVNRSTICIQKYVQKVIQSKFKINE